MLQAYNVRTRERDRRDLVRGIPKVRIYLWPLAKETVLEQLINRRYRPYQELRAIVPQILREAGLPEDAKFRWSQNAGCSCGCSPGFIVDVKRTFQVFAEYGDPAELAPPATDLEPELGGEAVA